MPTGTINNLKQALDCAGKCDCCEKLQQQINSLKSSVNNVESKTKALDLDIKNIIPRVNHHEARIIKLERNLNSTTGKDRNNTNKNVLDIQKLKLQMTAVEGYINALD